MTPTAYRAEILAAYQGEIAAAAVARVLAGRLDLTADQRVKLDAFERLELKVAAALAPVLARLGVELGDPAPLEAAGRARAEAIGGWDDLIAQFGDRLIPYIESFDRLRDAAEPEDAQALTLLSAHEHALLAFGRAEAEGRTEVSLACLAALLD